MIKTLKRRFILISMSALIILIIAIFISINMFMENKTLEQVDSYLTHVIQLERRELPPPQVINHPPLEPQIEGFACYVDLNKNIINTIFNDNNLDEEELESYIDLALQNNVKNGKLGNYHYRYKILQNGYFIVFADSSLQIGILNQLLKISYLISLISLVVLFFIILFLSNYIVKPVKESFEKQKRFISDSSHELKTPLSIMVANLDILENEIPDNKRIVTIKNNALMMNDLIHSLLVLTRTEKAVVAFEEFDLSELVEMVSLSLEALAFEHENTIRTDIQKSIKYKGNVSEIETLLVAIIDNSIKYSWKETEVSIRLYSKGNSVIIEVYNEGIGIKNENKMKIFDKFYREDDSRNKDIKGYGIGLSIVKNIVDNHKGKIVVETEENKYTLFKIIL